MLGRGASHACSRTPYRSSGDPMIRIRGVRITGPDRLCGVRSHATSRSGECGTALSAAPKQLGRCQELRNRKQTPALLAKNPWGNPGQKDQSFLRICPAFCVDFSVLFLTTPGLDVTATPSLRRTGGVGSYRWPRSAPRSDIRRSARSCRSAAARRAAGPRCPRAACCR
jgi:hypothetical protein